jgi:signal transduction histidine kinase
MRFKFRLSGDVMSEFVSALGASETYAVLRNPYILFGFLWGIPVPLLGILIARYVTSGRTGGQLPSMFVEPLFVFLALHPPLFAVVFGAMGTVRLRKIARIESLLREREAEMLRLRQAHRELERLTRLKDDFLGSVTHELKTPLVTIRGYAEMLEHARLGDVTDRQQQALSVMQRNCERLQQQIDLLLAASRNQSPAALLKPVAFPLRDLLDEVLDRHRPQATRKGIHLDCVVPEESISLWGDYARLQEVLDNLLSNAIKFTEPGGWVALRVGTPDADRLPIEIADSGCGIDVDAQAVIFERFRQADGSIRRRYGGSGLGLALVRENLEAHDCQITVRSAPGEGSRFTFCLPLHKQIAGTALTPTNRETTHG